MADAGSQAASVADLAPGCVASAHLMSTDAGMRAASEEAMKIRSLTPSKPKPKQQQMTSTSGALRRQRTSSYLRTKEEGGPERRQRARYSGDMFHDRILPALRYFYEIHAHLNVARLYVIPDDPSVPEHIRGFALGKRVDNMRARGDFVKDSPANLAALLEVGGEGPGQKFVWHSNTWKFDHQIVPALRYFKRKHGHLIIPRGYITPEHDPDLEPQARAFQLGTVTHDIRDRTKGFYLDQRPDRVQLLNDMGFQWETTNAEKWTLRDLPALRWFKKTHGHLAIPTTYECPRGREAADVGLPRIAAGMKLGARATAFRRGYGAKLDPHIVQKLDEMHFPWNMRDHYLYRVLLPAVSLFVATHGHLDFETHGVKSWTVPWGTEDVPAFSWGLCVYNALMRQSHVGPASFAGTVGVWDGRGCGPTVERLARFARLEAAVRHARDKFEDETGLKTRPWEEAFTPTLDAVRRRCEQ